MSRAGRWATSPLLLAVLIVAVSQVVVVDSTDNDPSLAPFTALSLVRDGDTDLRDLPVEVLVERPIVVSGQVAGTALPSVEAVRAALDASGPDAPVRDYFPIVPALLALPAVGLVDTVGPLLGWGDAREVLLEDRFTPFHVLTASLIVALAALFARAIALDLLSGSDARRRWTATAAALVFAFGTTAWSVAGRALWQHGPSLLALFAALWLVLRLRRDGGPAVGAWVAPTLGAVLALSVVTRPTNAVPAVAILGWVVWSRRRAALPLLLGAAVATVLAATVTAALGLGVPPPYYAASRVDVGAQTLGAIAANLVSPSRGLLTSTPVVLLAIPGAWLWWRRPDDRPLVVALGAWILGVLLAVSAFTQWWAGHTFASRFTTETLPALFLLAVPALDAVVPLRRRADAPAATRAGAEPPTEASAVGAAPAWMRTRAALAAVIVLATWSIGVHTLGSWSRQTSCWNDVPVDVDDDPGRVWSLADAQTGRAIGALVTHGPRRMVAGPC